MGIDTQTYNRIASLTGDATADYLLSFIYVGYVPTAYERKLIKGLL